MIAAAVLTGAWQLDTTPPQFQQASRGQAAQAMPVVLQLALAGGKVSGSAQYWRGDVQITDHVRGTFAGQLLDFTLVKGGFRFQGRFDAQVGEFTGKLIGPPEAAFRMHR